VPDVPEMVVAVEVKPTTWKDMVFYRERHDERVRTLTQELNGERFSVSACDIITYDHKFIEVKICEGKRPCFEISEDELKIAKIFKDLYKIYFYYKGELFIINGIYILKWAEKLKPRAQFGHKKQKQRSIELSKKHISELNE
jgi:hypothetical protein